MTACYNILCKSGIISQSRALLFPLRAECYNLGDLRALWIPPDRLMILTLTKVRRSQGYANLNMFGIKLLIEKRK